MGGERGGQPNLAFGAGRQHIQRLVQVRLQAQTFHNQSQTSLRKTAVCLALQLKVVKRCVLVKRIGIRLCPKYLLAIGHSMTLQVHTVDVKLPGIGYQRARQQLQQGSFATPDTACDQSNAWLDKG